MCEKNGWNPARGRKSEKVFPNELCATPFLMNYTLLRTASIEREAYKGGGRQ